MNLIRIRMRCKACDGTGIYVGMGEGDGYGVQCYDCVGTGVKDFKLEYEDPPACPRYRQDIHTVLRRNPGIKLGGCLDFGGMPYEDWYDGKPFPQSSEMRKFVCPKWWYQGTDKNPDWVRCEASWGKTFSHCDFFAAKNECWAKWDAENEV